MNTVEEQVQNMIVKEEEAIATIMSRDGNYHGDATPHIYSLNLLLQIRTRIRSDQRVSDSPTEP